MSVTDLVAAFGPKANDAEILAKCENLMKIYTLSADDLFVKWESYCVNNSSVDDETELSAANLDLLQSYIQQGLEKTLHSASKPKMMMRPASSPSQLFDFPATPTSVKKRRLESPLKKEAPNTPLKTPQGLNLNSSPTKMEPTTPTPHSDSGKTIETLNPEIPVAEGASLETVQVKLAPQFDAEKYRFRTMRQKLLEAADVLDDQIDTFAQIVQEAHAISTDEFHSPCVASQFDIVCVGRMVPDLPLTDAVQLNSSSFFLETSRLSGIGQRVALDLTQVPDYTFFPGQIVAFRGKNPTGEAFVVASVLELPYLGAPACRAQDFAESLALNDKALKVVVCAGPYTTTKDFDFVYLRALVEKLNNEIRPHTVIFLGPFIDITHPKIADGSIEVADAKLAPSTLDDVFRLVVSPILRSLHPKIQAIVIPSTRDAASKHSAYPQDSLDKKLLQLAQKNIKCYPNPAHFTMNEIHVGVSNNDVFRDLKDVVHGKFVSQNRFERVATQVIEQRRYYPVFPGGTKTRVEEGVVEHISGADLDMPYMGLSEMGEVTPDILIIPSELRFFAKVIKSVVVINPGCFMRPSSAGSYAVVSINPPVEGEVEKVGTEINEDTRQEEGLYVLNVWKRIRVDIVKT
ncbi:hypothetical protein BABINDRAFT_163001, partial [Babjeviella inositovora NRRL Y-12698]